MAAAKTASKTETKKPETRAKQPEKKANEWDELVPYFLQKPDGETQNARTVTLNGVNFQVQYNKDVMIPRKIAAILDESAINKAKADEEMNRLAGMHELGSV